MALRVRFHPEAAQEVDGAVDWYRERSADAAAGFVAELDYAIEQVTELPETWPAYKENTRRYVFRVLQSCLPPRRRRNYDRCRRSREAQARILDFSERLAFHSRPSNNESSGRHNAFAKF